MLIHVYAVNYAPEVSGTGPYTAGFAEHLAHEGHEVHVIAGVPHYPRRPQAASRASQSGTEALNGVSVHRSNIFAPATQSAFHRAAYEISFLPAARLFRTLPRPDAVVGVIPTLGSGALARLASQHFGSPYGLVFQDLMAPAATQSGIRAGRWFGSVARAGERWTAARASAVGIVSEGFRPYVESIGVPAGAIVRLRNWNQMPPARQDRGSACESFGLPQDAFICLHAGNIGHKQGLSNVVACAGLAAKADRDLLFVLAGEGNQRGELERSASAQGLGNVRFLTPQPNQAHADLLACADVLLLNQSANVLNMSFPSKVSSYTAAGKPIVAAVSSDSDIGLELESHGAALIVAPDRPEALLSGIRRVRDDGDLRRRLSEAARSYGERYFRHGEAMQAWQYLIERIVDQRVPSRRIEMEAA